MRRKKGPNILEAESWLLALSGSIAGCFIGLILGALTYGEFLIAFKLLGIGAVLWFAATYAAYRAHLSKYS